MKKISCIIIEDEPHAVDYLESHISRDSTIEVVGKAHDGLEALKLIKKLQPQLIFLDINLPGLSGMEIASYDKLIGDLLIVFTTAYDQYAVKAFEKNAIDYLLKPFSPDRIKQALERVKKELKRRAKENIYGKIEDLLGTSEKEDDSYISEVVIKEKGLELEIPIKSVAIFSADGVYIEVLLSTKTYLLRKSLTLLNSELDPNIFLRIHRSTIVNMTLVDHIKYNNDNTFTFHLSFTKVRSSRNYKENIVQVLKGRPQIRLR